MKEKIPLHIIGGFGDVTVGRKLKFLLLDERISSQLGLISILDRYPNPERIESNPRDFLYQDVLPKFKTPVSPEVLDALAEKIQSGQIRYYFSGDNGAQDFFKGVRPGDIVDISTPNLSHIKYLARAIRETLAHVIIEKPVVAQPKDVELARKMVLEAMISSPERLFVDAEHYSHYDLIKYYVDHLQQTTELFGKIKSIAIELREQEKFDNQRNRNVIDREVSGGGIWLDLGPHVLSFLTALDATIDKSTITAQRFKYDDPTIADARFQETRLETTFEAQSFAFANNRARVSIKVGKASDKTQKRFYIEHEHGYTDINLSSKQYTDARETPINIDQQDPFFNSYMDLVNSIRTGKTPRMPIQKSLDTLSNLFTIQKIARRRPMKDYSTWT